MRNLDELRWEQFHIGDIFSVERPSARNKDNYEDGDVPFVASGAINNGVMKCCKPKDDEKLDKRECITVSPVDGSTFYQAYVFYLHCNGCSPKSEVCRLVVSSAAYIF